MEVDYQKLIPCYPDIQICHCNRNILLLQKPHIHPIMKNVYTVSSLVSIVLAVLDLCQSLTPSRIPTKTQGSLFTVNTHMPQHKQFLFQREEQEDGKERPDQSKTKTQQGRHEPFSSMSSIWGGWQHHLSHSKLGQSYPQLGPYVSLPGTPKGSLPSSPDFP